MELSFFDYSMRESFLATFFMSIVMALIGTICVVKKKSLSSEMMAHLALPAVALVYLFAGAYFDVTSIGFNAILMLVVFIFCLISLKIANFFIKKNIAEDAVLCMLISFGIGFGVLIQSFLQKLHPIWYKKTQLFFYGQAATLVWSHVYVYATLAVLVVVFIALFHARLKWYLFDESFFQINGFKSQIFDWVIHFLIALTIVVGVRSCGIVLVSGMVIIPVITARQWTDSLVGTYSLSVVFASLSSMIGSYLSYILPFFLQSGKKSGFSVPLGPLLIATAFCFCFFSLLFAPKKGWVTYLYKQASYQFQVILENSLKKFWKERQKKVFHKKEIQNFLGLDPLLFHFLFFYLVLTGQIKREIKGYRLTDKGLKNAAYSVRVHRLLELYLTRELSVDLKKVHAIAEELEHGISPYIEMEMTRLLNNPTQDPHQKPIPKKEEVE